ncbi:hypothetical protein [Variovorax sp. W6]|uniref:hypothetical protein n=1 Tax=Variovorax sp. W6 TaxID=3093895 RepID=UPI003D806BD5
MRHFHLRRQPHEPRVRPSARLIAPAQAAAVEASPVVDAALDQAAALWTTRRIRSFLLLQPVCVPRR